jgi:hypothetical protein
MRSASTNADKPTSYHSGGAYSLPMTLMTLTVRLNDNGLIVDKPQLDKVPDKKMLFNLDYLPDITSDDTFKIELDGSGFLKQVTVSADDKKGPIIEDVAATVITLMTGIPVPVKDSTRALIKGGIALQQTINPNSDEDLRKLNAKLLKYGLEVKVDPFGTSPMVGVPPETNDTSTRTGIFYRPVLPYQVSILTTKDKSGDGEVFAAYVIYTENKSPLISVDISRSYFVKRETTLMFSTGILTSTEVKKPSEVLGLVRIPIDIATAIVGIPEKLIKFRIDQTSDQTTLLGNQQKLIEAQKSLLDAIAKAKTTAPPAGVSENQTTNPVVSENQRDGD